MQSFNETKIVILADGTFPSHYKALKKLKNADFIIACDGASDKLLNYGKIPNLIIGDLDSVSKEILAKYKDIILKVARQDNTDLMKAMDWCVEKGVKEVVILGATGGREDHTIGNLFSIMTYASKLRLQLYTDTGYFVTLDRTATLKTYAGQQISLFSQPQKMRITTEGLKFPLNNEALPHLHSGTLNEAEGENIKLIFEEGVLLVYRVYP